MKKFYVLFIIMIAIIFGGLWNVNISFAIAVDNNIIKNNVNINNYRNNYVAYQGIRKNIYNENSIKINNNMNNIILAAAYESDEEGYPVFYGTIGITLKVGDKLNLKDSAFRLFASDFYDGDLTQKITPVSYGGLSVDTSGNVNTNISAGTYYIQYKVTNSQNKSKTIKVEIKLNSKTSSDPRTIQRKLYCSNDFTNIELMKQPHYHMRGNYEEKQNLGIYTKKDAQLSVRQINNNYKNKVEISFLNNDAETEKKEIIGTSWSTISPIVDSVPFVQTASILRKI